MSSSTSIRKLAYVEWVDCFGCSSVWVDLDEINREPVICKSVGWILLDNDDVLVIVPHFTQENHSGARFQGCGDMTIPKSAIRNVSVLTIPTKTKSNKVK